MRPTPIYYTWQVQCATPEACETLRRTVPRLIDLNRVITTTSQTFLAGVPHVKTEHYRLGDYFSDIQLEPGSAESFFVVFRRLQDAPRFWKDLMVISVLGVIVDAAEKPKITLNRRARHR